MPALIPALTDPIIDAGPLIYQGLGRPVGLGVAGRLLADPPAPAHPVRRPVSYTHLTLPTSDLV